MIQINFDLLINKVDVRMTATWLASYTITAHRTQPQRAPVRIIMHEQYHVANQVTTKPKKK